MFTLVKKLIIKILNLKLLLQLEYQNKKTFLQNPLFQSGLRKFFLKDKKVITITNAFQKILNESKREPNKIWVDKGSGFYNRSIKSWLEKNDIEMYSTHNEAKSVIAERFIRTLKTTFMNTLLPFQKMFILINQMI